MNRFGRHIFTILFVLGLLSVSLQRANAQSTATLQGTVVDAQGGAVSGAQVTVRNVATGQERTTESDNAGNFQFSSLPPGNYRIEIRHEGFQSMVIGSYTLDVSSIASRTFTLQVGAVSQTMEVSSEAPVIESSTMTVGQVIDEKTVQEIPLNGRHFVDLGLLIPGSVTPPQSGFLTAPLRGQGSFAFNTAGNREDTVNFMINGINLNDMVQNQITFQPSINTVSEFKVDNSTYSAEFGRNSGAIVNIVTRSGTNQFHGEVFEFIRNNALDARNFFNPVPVAQNPFKRNQFGAAVGGPIWRDHTFFFFSYEGLRQRQGITINSGVLSAAERADAQNRGNPAVLKLLNLIPTANGVNAQGNAVFRGSATAPVNIDQWTGDVSHDFNSKDRLHGYYAFQRDRRGEPILQLNTIPGFGDTRQSHRQILTLNETHIFSPTVVNEARLGFNRIHITFTPNAQLNPADFAINNGITTPIGLPQIAITTINLNFGGPAGFPQGRGDTTAAFSDTFSWQRGRHALKFGGEVRRFYNDNFSLDTGTFTFPDVSSFNNGGSTGTRFAINLSNGASRIVQPAWGLFAMDSIKLAPNLTVELGVRYDWNSSPSEALNRFVVFDPGTSSLVQVGNGIDQVYQTNNRNVEPRVGFAWDPFKTGKTSIRGGYAIQTDQPVTNTVTPLTTNPPFGNPLQASAGTVSFGNARAAAAATGLSPSSITRDFKNPYVQSWNLNVQRALTSSLGLTVGYFGSKGTHLRVAENLNQFVSPGTRPFRTNRGAIRNGVNLGNITEINSGTNSSYNGLWVTANKRFSRGLQFNASYTYSHSIDYNSLSSQGIVVQDSRNIRGDRASSDFDARNRFVINWIYELPFKGNRLIEGWQVSAITQWQTGNPINILAGNPPACPVQPLPPARPLPVPPGCSNFNNTSLTGVATLRPDLTGRVQLLKDPAQWFTNLVCNPITGGPCPAGAPFTLPVSSTGVFHFGNLGRNTLIGPGFSNTDLSVQKTTRITERLRVQFRAEVFDLFNHPNFGQPARIATPGNTSFGSITTTRFPAGDSGSSRQLQFALKFMF